MTLNITAACTTGCIRDNNEDMALLGSLFIRDDKIKQTISSDHYDRYMVAVADGMGGHNSGEVASSEVLHNLQYFFGDMPKGFDSSGFTEAIFEWLASINHLIDGKGRVEEKYNGMGTTLVALAYYGGDYYWMNCGDSRIYRFSNGNLQQLSTDHSLNTLLGEEEHSHIITNCIGGGCKHSFIDVVNITDEVKSGDTFLLCSDGLTDMLSDQTIQELLNEGTDAYALCNAAEEAGGYDNVTAIIVKVES